MNEQQRSMSAASREAMKRDAGPTRVVSSPALSERAQLFRIPENATIETALSLSFTALGLDNWAEVKRELARHLRATTMQIASETRTW